MLTCRAGHRRQWHAGGDAKHKSEWSTHGVMTYPKFIVVEEYVPKPFSPRQLLAKIRNFLQ
jgi:hypothetical protein